MTDGSGGLKLPLPLFNPMGKEHVAAMLDRLIAAGAEGTASRVCCATACCRKGWRHASAEHPRAVWRPQSVLERPLSCAGTSTRTGSPPASPASTATPPPAGLVTMRSGSRPGPDSRSLPMR